MRKSRLCVLTHSVTILLYALYRAFGNLPRVAEVGDNGAGAQAGSLFWNSILSNRTFYLVLAEFSTAYMRTDATSASSRGE